MRLPTHITDSRPTGKPAPMVPAIDALRGYCALMVILPHCWMAAGFPPLDRGPLLALVCAGGLGVDFFFVISGFVLFLPVARTGRFGSVRAYAARRAARIVPAYWVSVISLAALYPLLTGAPAIVTTREGLTALGIHLLFLQHEVPDWLRRTIGAMPGMGFGVNTALWSLSVEVCFYVALPLLAGSFRRRPGVGLAVGLATALAWRALAFRLPSVASVVGVAAATDATRPRLATQFPGYAGHFALGMAAAWLFTCRFGERRDLGGRRVSAVAAGAFAVLLAAAVRAGQYGVERSYPSFYARYLWDLFPAAVFTVLLLALALAPRRLEAVVANPVARWLGTVSYGVYLWHWVAIHLAVRTLGLAGDGRLQTFLLLVAVVAPASVLAGWLSLVLVERPVLRRVRARLARSTTPVRVE